MNEITLVMTSLKDFFTKPIIKIAFYPLLITTVILYLLFFAAADASISAMENHVMQVESSQTTVSNNGVVDTTQTQETYIGKGIIDFLLKYSITSWLAGFLIYTVGSVIVLMFSLFLTLLIIGFLTPMILSIIKKRHYADLEFLGDGTVFSTVVFSIKTVLIMLLLFVVLIPFYFIPLVNIVAFNLPLYYMFHKLLTFDIASTIMTREEYAILKVKNSSKFRFRTLFLYIVSMIPFITLFSTVFYIVYLGHGYMQKLQELRNTPKINY